MTDSEKLLEEKILEILEAAILDEQTSAKRYLHAMSLAKEEELRDMFQKLAQDEVEHEKALKEKYHDIKKRLGLRVMKDK